MRRIEGVACTRGLKRRRSYLTRETQSQASSPPKLTGLLSWFVETLSGLTAAGEAVMCVSNYSFQSKHCLYHRAPGLAPRVGWRAEGWSPSPMAYEGLLGPGMGWEWAQVSPSFWRDLRPVSSLETQQQPELELGKENQATQGPFYALSSELAFVGGILCICGIINFLKSLGSTLKFSA